MGEREERIAMKLEKLRRKRLRAEGLSNLRAKLKAEKLRIRKADSTSKRARFFAFAKKESGSLFRSGVKGLKRATKRSRRKRNSFRLTI